MNKEQYLAELETIKGVEKQLLDRRNELREIYINTNKPCDIGDMVEITLNSGRKVIGQAHEFGILQDKGVHITAYRDPSNKTRLRYISAPHGEVKQINK